MYRGWGRAGTSFLADNERGCPGDGSCWVASGSTAVQLVDWSLRASGVASLATSDSPAGFADGAACPAAVQGSRVAYDMHSGERLSDGVGNDDGVCEPGENCDGNTYLLAALEIIGDRRGDDDGLCESDEACIAAPNFGAYQGDGDYAEHRCVFADDIVHGVTMFGYPVNGR